MWATILLAALAGTGSAGAPPAQPSSTAPLRVIVTVKSSTLCSAVRKIAIPIGYVNRVNEDGFSSIDRTMYAYLKGAAETSPISGSEQQPQSVSEATREAAPIDSVRIMTMNKTAWRIAQNLTLESSVMQRSWKDFPKGEDPNVDAMRQRLQNLIDLQNALENKITSFTEGVLDNGGNASSKQVAAYLGASFNGQIAALRASQQQSDPEMLAAASASDLSRSGTQAEIVRELRLQEIAFSSEIVKAGTVCGI